MLGLSPLQNEISGWVSDILTAVIAALALWATKMIREIRNRKAKPLDVEGKAMLDKRVTELLQYLRIRLDAQRAYLSRYHNGDYFTDGSTVLKKTRTHEAVKEGIAYQGEQIKNVLISTIADEVKLVIDEGPSFTRVDDLPSGKFKWVCMEGGARAIARCAVRKAGKIVGFVGVDFDNIEQPADLEVICEIAGRIEGLI